MICGVLGIQLQGRLMAFLHKSSVHGVKAYDTVDCISTLSEPRHLMRMKDQLHNSLRLASQGNQPVHSASKAGLPSQFFLTDQEGQSCKGKFIKNDVCKRDTISL